MSYNKKVWKSGDRITKEALNNMENGIEAAHQNSGGGGTSYDDTAIKSDINTIKTDLGTEELTTTAKDVKGAVNEVAAQYKDIVNRIENGNIGNKVEPQDSDIPRVFFNGEKPVNKTAVHATIEYKSKTEHFKGYVEIKCQGTSSMAYPKKNYTIKMFTDSTMAKKVKKDFKGWGAQSKFCLKANYIDHSHARNICAAKLWNQIVASRENYALLPELLRTSPCNGAIDGFPIKVYYNNTYEGVYTWNIPKDKWMFNMDDTLDNHCVLCGEEYNSGCFLTANARLWSDEIHDAMPANIVTSFNAFQNFVISSSDEQFKTNLENYVYVDSLIDYYIFQYAICGLDSMGKNQLFATYDGTKWIATSYDMDSTFGLYWNGQKFVTATYRMQEDYESVKNGAANKLYIRLEQLFVNEIKARYAELRADILSYNNIVNTFEPFMDIIGNDLYAEDLTIYTAIPSGAGNNIKQIRNYYKDRVAYVDAQIDKLVTPIPCTAITLNNTTLSFTTDAAQTLTATVTPTDTTDTVVWSVNPTGFVTVNNGVVTPVSNGNCIITATCGSQTTTCNIVVNLPNVAVTSLSLDKNTLNCFLNENLNNMLTGIESSTVGSLLVFNNITLESGIYLIKNIDGGSFTWLGYTIDGSKKEPNGNTTSQVIFQVLESKSVSISGNPNGNTPDKLALYKLSLQNLQSFIKEGDGYFGDDGNIVNNNTDIYSKTLNLDSSKTYGVILKNTVSKSFNGRYICMLADGICTKGTGTVMANSLIATFNTISKLAISINHVATSASLDDIIIYELVPETQKNTTLKATITPTNATNKNVTWSSDNENIELVTNGLDCTVKAKVVGNSVVTCTSQDTTNGTISDACNVTVSV